MKIKKFLVLIGVIIMSSSLIASCVSGRVKLAEDKLYEKYNEKFKIKSQGNSVYMGNDSSFTVVCSPEDNDDIVFEAKVYLDGTKIYDSYREALLGNEMKKTIAQNINPISNDFEALIDFESIADDYEKNMPVMSYNNSHDTICYTVLAINIDDSEDFTPQQLYSALQNIYRGFGKTGGGISLYLVDRDSMNEIRKYMKKNPEIDGTLLEMCGNGFKCIVENGELQGSLTDMETALE